MLETAFPPNNWRVTVRRNCFDVSICDMTRFPEDLCTPLQCTAPHQPACSVPAAGLSLQVAAAHRPRIQYMCGRFVFSLLPITDAAEHPLDPESGAVTQRGTGFNRLYTPSTQITVTRYMKTMHMVLPEVATLDHYASAGNYSGLYCWLHDHMQPCR